MMEREVKAEAAGDDVKEEGDEVASVDREPGAED